MERVQSLLSRVRNLEMLVKSRAYSRDELSQQTSSSNRPLMALHITSDILFTKANISKNGITGLPRNINLNIALKNNAKLPEKPNAGILSNGKNGKFSVNSTVFLEPDTGNEIKSGIATPSPAEGEAMTEREVG